ncbi:DUF1800 family protein [Chelatococcus sp. SYSU_G07232]|uniref:DUF1800 family protein n=1 Tax=Chelatococcus albus TaxID=3047466 RepID=A0ABT7AIQ2_9HYPH|nr:DUF1800 family protein [Chelatococcus sp. SYSU_G07232]MDJ1159258.1 DUF1800 family protein [Chelatococcus sp. SYSU_G07232]
MALERDAALAVLGLNRFGLGPRPGDLARMGADIRDVLAAEVRRRAVPQPEGPDLLTGVEAFRAWRAEEDLQRLARMGPGAAGRMAAEAGARPESLRIGGMEPNKPTGPIALGAGPPVPQRLYRAEAAARLSVGVESGTGFAERLTLFWSNHFCVSAAKGGHLRTLAGAFEREAIRPHVFGRFADMLLAVARHPAMLIYLDNQESIGPNSPAGRRRGRGLNENLAREILELHTLGVDGGYGQEDVTSLARIITGWTVAYDDKRGAQGRFTFNANLHEPGDHAVLGVSHREGGAEQGEQALLALARHPATARHVARKLARHFIADEPPPKLVERLTRTFRDSDGDLAALSLALVEAPEAWVPEAHKLRLPYEFLVAALRTTGRKVEAPPLLAALAGMGQPLWTPSGPNGFPDTVAAWVSPEGVKARLDVAAALGRQAAGGPSPPDLVDAVLGAACSRETRQAVARAESRAQAVALLLMSPEFQRR